ncbi:sensor histidine kinase [Flexithrix dorotheae]|uniref:sensor histidine kinase n=1 Tax=Flexithrix dorotheae TaxID=70993 RepID=UPI000476BBF6|nr:histidine kinase [Flexithrix dorotheae]
MKRSIVILLHVGFWICYFLLVLVILGAIYGSRGEVDDSKIEAAFKAILFFALVPSAISFYLFYFLLFPRFLEKKNIFLTIVYGVMVAYFAAMVGWSILSGTFGEVCDLGGEYEDEDYSEAGVILFMTFIAFVSGIIAWVIQGFLTWVKEIKLKEALVQKNHEMELALVKSQLDPHFLFNTINNIDVLILKNAEDASNYLNKLSDIMRFMLFETKTEEILLAKELEYMDKYIALQKIRTSNANYVNYQVNGTANGKTIAPMVFIPFLENAFKHTNNKKLQNAINIDIQIEENAVKMKCENKFDPTRKPTNGYNGLGNELIKKRLNLIYPERHQLEVVKKNESYMVSLTINNRDVLV